MTTRRFYGLFLDVEGRKALIVGGGAVAFRKAAALVEAGARVTVVAPEFDARFDALPVDRIRREYAAADLEGAALAFAATNVRAVNAAVARDAKARGIPVNVADSPEECDFIAPARIRRGDIHIAISTSATRPALAAELRKRIEMLLDDILRSGYPSQPI
jgi:precorrin-2 dehydrogenase/sirohydrochlorin ferrochelatase